MSYSLPAVRFNITNDNNNIFKFKIDGVETIVEVPSGKYDIADLIYRLNELLLEYNIKLSISIEQKIIIESDNNFELIETNMIKYNLGFTKIGEYVIKNNYISENVWDLRIDDKVYLYLSNLEDETPFGVLYFTGHSVSQFKFQNPFNLNKLDIIFKNSYGGLYNFHNLPHILSFLIEKIN
jgi:hypothetical protein